MVRKIREWKSLRNLVLLLALAPAVALAQPTQVTAVCEPPEQPLLNPTTANCVPSCERDDGRFLVITDGEGLETLTDTTLDLQIRSPGDGFDLSVFDGETSGAAGLWDLEPAGTLGTLTFNLYADPDGDGVEGEHLATFEEDQMKDNAWCSFSLDDYPAAMSPSGEHVYLLRANFDSGGDAGLRTLFKVATSKAPEGADVLIEVFQQPFSFAAAVPDPAGATRLEIIYPDCAGKTLVECLDFLDNTTYNGEFSFYLTVRDDIDELVIWDGDLDHGDGDPPDRNSDEDDFNTANDHTGLPYWACRDLDPNSPCTADGDGNPRLPSINFEGVARGAGLCQLGLRDGQRCTPGCPGAGAFCDFDLDAPGASRCVGGSRDGDLCRPGCPGGTCSVTGDPPDDFFLFGGLGRIFRRDGTITYEVWGPGGQRLATNLNPSGNREWERFRLSTTPGDTDADKIVGELPAGIYEIRVKGLDLENLNAFRFDAPAVTEPSCDDGRPTALTFTYTADSCAEPGASNNSQGGLPGTSGDYECSGPLVTGDPREVKLVPVKKPERFEMVPESAVPGGQLTIRAKTSNDRLFPHTELEIQDAVTHEVLQSVTIHTSCSQPLNLDEQFGSLVLSNYFIKF